MDSKTLLLLTYHFPPSAAVAVYRMLGFVRYLPTFGWRTIVVAPPKMPHEPEDPALLRLVPPETPVFRVPFPGGIRGKFARRFFGNNAWLTPALEECKRIIPRFRPDAMLTSSPPASIHTLGMRLQRRYGIPWVACLRDPLGTNRFLSRGAWRDFWDKRVETRMVARADAVVANTPLNLEGLQAAYPAYADKMLTVPNGFDPESFPEAPPREEPGIEVNLLHAGEIYLGRDPRPLLDALRVLAVTDADEPPVSVTFLGRHTEGAFDLPTEIAERGLQSRATLLGQAPYAVSLERMVSADVLLLLHTPGSRVGVPAKLYEYLGAGRPILALAEPDGDIAWVLRESGVLHRVARPTDVPAIQKAIGELRAELKRGVESNRPQSNPFTRENMALRMAECLDGVAARFARQKGMRQAG